MNPGTFVWVVDEKKNDLLFGVIKSIGQVLGNNYVSVLSQDGEITVPEQNCFEEEADALLELRNVLRDKLSELERIVQPIEEMRKKAEEAARIQERKEIALEWATVFDSSVMQLECIPHKIISAVGVPFSMEKFYAVLNQEKATNWCMGNQLQNDTYISWLETHFDTWIDEWAENRSSGIDVDTCKGIFDYIVSVLEKNEKRWIFP